MLGFELIQVIKHFLNIFKKFLSSLSHVVSQVVASSHSVTSIQSPTHVSLPQAPAQVHKAQWHLQKRP